MSSWLLDTAIWNHTKRGPRLCTSLLHDYRGLKNRVKKINCLFSRELDSE